ncbi:hypothetical protein, partial [Ancylobacter sonchi]
MARLRASERSYQTQQITQVGFGLSFNPAQSEKDRALFDKVCDAIGSTAQYIQRDVMGDIADKLVDEMWFGSGRSHAPEPSFNKPYAPARSSSGPEQGGTASIYASVGHG